MKIFDLRRLLFGSVERQSLSFDGQKSTEREKLCCFLSNKDGLSINKSVRLALMSQSLYNNNSRQTSISNERNNFIFRMSHLTQSEMPTFLPFSW